MYNILEYSSKPDRELRTWCLHWDWMGQWITWLRQTVCIGVIVCWRESVVMYSDRYWSLRLQFNGRRGEWKSHRGDRMRKEAWSSVWGEKMRFADQIGLLALIRSPVGWGESDYPHLLGTLPDFWNGHSLHVSLIHVQNSVKFMTAFIYFILFISFSLLFPGCLLRCPCVRPAIRDC